MLAFWRHGYETTSIADLTAAMGITAPSLYTAFGDKKRLFLEAMRRYAGDPDAMAERIRDAASARAAAADLLRSAARAYTGEHTPKGCLLASATASGSADAADVRRAVAEVRGMIADRLRERIERDVLADVLPTATRPAALAGMVIAVVQGLSVLARDGASRAQLVDIAEQALAAWPA